MKEIVPLCLKAHIHENILLFFSILEYVQKVNHSFWLLHFRIDEIWSDDLVFCLYGFLDKLGEILATFLSYFIFHLPFQFIDRKT